MNKHSSILKRLNEKNRVLDNDVLDNIIKVSAEGLDSDLIKFQINADEFLSDYKSGATKNVVVIDKIVTKAKEKVKEAQDILKELRDLVGLDDR